MTPIKPIPYEEYMNQQNSTEKRTCPSVIGKETIGESYAAYLVDESRMDPEPPEAVYFPADTAETAIAVRECLEKGYSITVSGARTGIVGGAVNLETEALLSLEKAFFPPEVQISPNPTVRVGAGMTLEKLEAFLREYSRDKLPEGREIFFPVDPTERSASLGGMAAANASGARTFAYGPMRKWVKGLTAVLADGSVLEVTRGNSLLPEDLEISSIPMPGTKHTAGYHLQKGMDPVDLFLGSEGTLGIITELVLRLEEKRGEGLYLFLFPGKSINADLVAAVVNSEQLNPLALEYMDGESLNLLRNEREHGKEEEIPPFPADAAEAFYLEFTYETEEELDTLYGALEEVFTPLGVSLDTSWAGFSEKEREEMKAFRHALPECINTIIGGRKRENPGLTKIGTDFAVPLPSLKNMMEKYRQTLDSSGLEYYIFGHIGDGHLHVNILPENSGEQEKAWSLYMEFAQEAAAAAGSVAAEHGIGRLKKKLLPLQYSGETIKEMKRIKDYFDPQGVLNPGVLF